jgi:hypothetical protein
MALAFLALFGLVVPPLLNLGTTNLLDTSRLAEQRATVYAADAATDGAIQFLRMNPGCGRALESATTCPTHTGPATSTFTTTLNGLTATATITGTSTNPLVIDRTVTITTSVGGKTQINATAVIHDPGTGAPATAPVDLTSWTYVR